MSRQVLGFIAILDKSGLATVNLNVVGAVTFFILLGIRFTLKKYRGVDWYAFLHAIVSGSGSLLAVYLDANAAYALTGLGEPLRSCMCHGPLTSLHRILPAITMGYSLLDLLDGLGLGIDFALHGIFTFSVMIVFIQLNAPHVVTPFLLMEVSTINLTLVRADFFSDTVALVNQACFAFLFFLFRIVVCPYLWAKLCWTMYEERNNEVYQNCFSPYVLPITFVFGAFFHILNSFWFYKILRKIKRKASGSEGIKANNDLVEEEEEKRKKKLS
mmetsp:Transcript_2991/g.4017  ORF Transcript_2991/g.4017 Transcript_2991/m.4017 type:complete len:272 (-) Transcript_2991:266-1081(-)